MEYKNYKYSGINFIRATNKNGLSIIFCPVGASIKSISLDGNELILTPKDATGFLNKDNILGKFRGPVSEESILLNGKNYTFSDKWNTSSFIFNARPLYENNYFFVQYSFSKKKNEDGLPGNVKYLISYTLSDSSNDLLVDIKALSDADTPISLTNKIPFIFTKKLGDDKTLNLENEFSNIEVTLTGYDHFEINEEVIEETPVINVSPKDKEMVMASQLKPYQRQILYRFNKK